MNIDLAIAKAAKEPETTELAAKALKTIASDPNSRNAFLNSHLTQDLMGSAATRYVAANRTALLARLQELAWKGYQVGTELVGEAATDPQVLAQIVAEYLGLIKSMAVMTWPGDRPSLNFDLSNLGLLVSPTLAESNLRRICAAAAETGHEIVLSMEGAALVQDILGIFHRVHRDFPFLGITVQAFRERTVSDLDALLNSGARLRLVKGVYDEPESQILASGALRDQRYFELAQRMAESGCPLMLATHDHNIINAFRSLGAWPETVEVEMLHGVRPALASNLREQGIPVRIYAAYGSNFFLHFLHRLAEYPENILVALADFAEPTRLTKGKYS